MNHTKVKVLPSKSKKPKGKTLSERLSDQYEIARHSLEFNKPVVQHK